MTDATRVVVISGGSSGIGLACVNKFLDNNYKVYNLDINPAKNYLSHTNYHYLATDLTKQEDLDRSIQLILKQQNNIDILIISAGIHISANIEDTESSQLMAALNVNLLAAFWLIKKIIPTMRQLNQGNIITIGSDQSIIAKYNSTVYGMTKAALASLTKSVALDYAKYNIRANCIAAGTIDTPLYRQAISNYALRSGISLDEIERLEANMQPLARIGKPSEIAEVAYFLCQKGANYITGSVIPVDGGYTTT